MKAVKLFLSNHLVPSFEKGGDEGESFPKGGDEG